MIARELHDELGQSVTAIRSMALSIAARAQARDAESERAARLIADESSRLYRAMHGMIPRLVPLVLDSFGLDEALRDLVERTRRSQPGLSIDLQAQPPAEPLSDEAAITLYRAAQEGITNAQRHGQASALRIALRADPDGVLLEVTDDGTGVSAQPVGDGTHYGLRWLAERVEGVGGRLALQSVEPRGARLTVRVPVARRAVPA
jgi:two-component system sensor histidine kinase UhpB